MKTVSLKLPDALHARLMAAAKRGSTSKSAVVREALEAYFADGNASTEMSCLDLGKGIWGSLQGPGDLSYNKKHMEGYGR